MIKPQMEYLWGHLKKISAEAALLVAVTYKAYCHLRVSYKLQKSKDIFRLT